MKSDIFKKVFFVTILLILSIVSNGQYAVFFAIWIFIALLLFSVRKLNRWRGFLLAFSVLGIGYFLGFDVVPFLPLAISIIITIIFSAFISLPFLIDSIFSKKRNSFLSTFIFPCSFVIIEYVYHLFYPYGSWGHLAYTQESQTILLQSISVFGLSFITFLITWFASVCNWVYEHRHEWNKIKKGIYAYSLVIGLTLIYGTYRVNYQNPNSETIRVASISASDSLAVNFSIDALNKDAEKNLKIEAKRQTTVLNQYLFTRSIKEAEAGAEIVFWAETNAVILKEDEQELYRKASQIASEQSIYLGISVAVIDYTQTKFLENKFVLFDRDGNKSIDYWKGISVPNAEVEISNNQPSSIQKIETDYGTISGVICFDLDFPNYLKNAKGTDMLLAPSNDYDEISQMHADMAKFRAIEQGFNLVRQTSNGLSIGTDYTGNVLSEMNHFTDNSKVMITQLPTKGVKTIYSVIGDAFIVVCSLLFITSILLLKRQQDKI